MRYSLPFAFVLLFTTPALGRNQDSTTVIWHLDNFESIGGNRPSILGNPLLVDSTAGKVIEFDGEGDALVFDRNPLAGATAFTLEVVFRPDTGGNREQRFVHMQEVDDHRVLIETRVTPDKHWFLDTFLKSGDSECTLFAKEYLHPIGKWFHAALVYEDGRMRHYVNGVKEMECSVDFRVMVGGQTSVGSRLNRVYWFKGAIKEISATPRALSPADFVLSQVE